MKLSNKWLSLFLKLLIIPLFLTTVYFIRKTLCEVSLAQARSGVSSIAVTLQVELASMTNDVNTMFLSQGSGRWNTLSSERYRRLINELARRHILDISRDGLDPWGREYQIEYKKEKQVLLLRVASLGPSGLREVEGLMINVSVQLE
jgi:predicted membrane metal-binding protein